MMKYCDKFASILAVRSILFQIIRFSALLENISVYSKIFSILMILPISAIHAEFCKVSSGDNLRKSDSTLYLVASKTEGVAPIIHLISKDILTLILYSTSVNNRWH